MSGRRDRIRHDIGTILKSESNPGVGACFPARRMEGIQTWRNEAGTIPWAEICQLRGSAGAMAVDSAEAAKSRS